jgi:hypothetical protein
MGEGALEKEKYSPPKIKTAMRHRTLSERVAYPQENHAVLL